MSIEENIGDLAVRMSEGPVTVLTGAGVSAASGVPTFRGFNGLWRQHRPDDLATPEAFERDSELVWEWYDWRRQHVRSVRAQLRAHSHRGLDPLPQELHAHHAERRRSP